MRRKIKLPALPLALLALFFSTGTAQSEDSGEEGDPLAELEGLENSLQTEDPQAGGSIRDKSAPKIIRRENKTIEPISKADIKKDN